MKIFDHTIYAPNKTPKFERTSVSSVVNEYIYGYRVNVYSGSESAWTLDKEVTFTYDDWNLIQEQTASGSDISLTNSVFTQFRTSNYTYSADKRNDEGVKTSNGNGLEEALYKGFAFELIYVHKLTALQVFRHNPFGFDTAGVVKAHYEYSPFGKVVHKSGPLADKNTFQFSTKYLDNKTQLYYYGLRYYNPEQGRWINRDPIEERGGLNLYGFVFNISTTLYDYLGMDLQGHNKLRSRAIPTGIDYDTNNDNTPEEIMKSIIGDILFTRINMSDEEREKERKYQRDLIDIEKLWDLRKAIYEKRIKETKENHRVRITNPGVKKSCLRTCTTCNKNGATTGYIYYGYWYDGLKYRANTGKRRKVTYKLPDLSLHYGTIRRDAFSVTINAYIFGPEKKDATRKCSARRCPKGWKSKVGFQEADLKARIGSDPTREELIEY